MLNLRWINALSIAGIHPGSMTAYIPPKNNHYLEVSNTSRNWNSVMLPRMIRICWMTQEKEATSICHFLPFSANASTISGMWWQKAICSFTHQSHTLHFWPWKGPHKPANSGLLLEHEETLPEREERGLLQGSSSGHNSGPRSFWLSHSWTKYTLKVVYSISRTALLAMFQTHTGSVWY